jgi:septum formation protein
VDKYTPKGKTCQQLEQNNVFVLNTYVSNKTVSYIYQLMISWQHPGRQIILASNSPRRKTILAQMGFSFRTAAPALIDETAYIKTGSLAASLKKLAKAKADSVAAAHPQALVLGADTVVARGKMVLGKPADRKGARAMLASLSGSRHSVHTGVALVCKTCSFSATASARTDVFFRKLQVDEIEQYLSLEEGLDKAGSYAIQGRAMIFIDRLYGCYYNVVGLPVARTIGLFKRYVLKSGVTDGAE